jgi:predicted extracellular nuclease
MRRSLTLAAVVAMTFTLTPVASAASNGCGDPYTPIYEIQGSGSSSPIVGSTVTTEGVVTVDVQRDEEHDGFFLQDINGDGDPTTSDGIFVLHQNYWGFDVEAGDLVRITAQVSESYGETQLGFVDVGSAKVCSTATMRPVRVKTRDFNANPEQYEGMFIEFKGSLFVTDTFNLHRFGQIWLGDDGVIETPTNEYPAGADEMFALALDNMAQSVMLASRLTRPDDPPFFHEGDTLRLGDRVQNPNGAIKYSFGNYKMVNNPDPVFDNTNRRPGPPDVKGDVVVASFNVLNYWTTLGGRGARFVDQLAIQTEKLVAAIRGMGADIVGLQEIENDPSHTPITALVDALNAAEGADVWSWVGPVNFYNIYPIRNEIIYRNDRVTPVGNPVSLNDPAFNDFRSDEPSPSNQLGRPPVAQTFRTGDATFTVVVAHLKSKSSTGATGLDADQGDGQAAYNARRVLQAQAILDWLPDLMEASGDPDVIVIGDMNAYAEEDPILTFEQELVNLVRRYVKDPYSFNFFAGFAAPFIGRGTLEGAFITPAMDKQVRDVEYWHINADEPRVLDWFDPDIVAPGPYRSSDHDPLLIGLDLDDDDHPGQGAGQRPR